MIKTHGTTQLYSKTGLYRSLHIFLIFVLNHRLLVLVRNINSITKKKKSITISYSKHMLFNIKYGNYNDFYTYRGPNTSGNVAKCI